MNRQLVLVFSLLIIASPALLAGKIYKWVDADGNINYSAEPPPSNSQEITVRTAPASAPATAPAAPGASTDAATDAAKPVDRKDARNKLLESMAKDREDKAKAEEKAAKDLAQRQENCSRARKNLASLKMGGPRFTVSESGERKYLNDEEIVQQTQQAEKDIAAWCN